MENTYWNNKGQFQEQFDDLIKLMPIVGNCETQAGEMIRAANRLAYDFYNNGMGNNTSGAANFLLEKGAIDYETYVTVYEYTRGRLYHGDYDGDDLQVAIERTIDQTVEFIMRNPTLVTAANTEDMLNFSDPDKHYDDEYEYDED